MCMKKSLSIHIEVQHLLRSFETTIERRLESGIIAPAVDLQ